VHSRFCARRPFRGILARLAHSRLLADFERARGLAGRLFLAFVVDPIMVARVLGVTSSLARAVRGLRRSLSASLCVPIALAACASAVTLTVASRAEASSPYLEIPDPATAMQTPAYRYANMTDDEAYAELDRRAILYSRVASVSGVRAPIRLTGRLHGVLIRSALPPEERASSIFEICDARLALALDDFSAILARHDVDEVVHFTMYRPNVPQPAAQRGKELMSSGVAARTDASDATDANAHQTSRPSKRRAFLDEKGSKGSKAHSASHISNASGESRRKDPFNDLSSDSLFEDNSNAPSFAEPTVFAKGAGVESFEGALSPNSAKTPPKDKATKALPASAQSGKKVAHGVHPVTKAGAKSTIKGAATFDDEAPHGTWAPPGTRHPAGLAIDVGMLKKKNGKILSIASNFEGKLGERTCGAGSPVPESEEARELRSIVCEAHDAGVFTYTLTPNYNVAHRDHFHMEIKPGVTWFLYN
jgi:hypothetical protein